MKECWVVWFEKPDSDTICYMNSHIKSVHSTKNKAEEARKKYWKQYPMSGGEFVISKATIED